MPVITVRVPEEDLFYLRARDQNVSDVVRRALHAEVEWMRLQEARDRLEKARFRPSRPAEDLIREDRDRRG